MSLNSNVIDVHEATFESDVIQKSYEKPVVVDFWAAWCGPCRMLGPILERLAHEPGAGFVLAKVDVDANPGLAMRFGVQGIPAVKAFHNGKVAGEFVGAQPEPRVRQFIQSIAPSAAQESLESAESLMAKRKWGEAEKLYREMLEDDPANNMTKLGLTRTMIAQGKGCQAKGYLEDLLNDSATYAQSERLIPVADFVCAYANGQNAMEEITVVEAQYRQAAHLLAQGKLAPAMDGLLDVLRHNKNYRDGQAKAVMLGIFEILGDEDPLTSAYRRELAMILF